MRHVDIVSINTGKPRQVPFQNKEVSTGIFKIPVPAHQSLFLSRLNFEGDGQADLVHHGGREKAVCVYPCEHYPYWENHLQKPLDYGAFGENLTIRGLLETDVCIGDVFQLGEARVQVSQPRQPCYKLSVRHQAPDMPLIVQETGYTGFYFRVLQEGRVRAADGLTRISRHPQAITVDRANRAMHREKDRIDEIRAILDVAELSEHWRSTFIKRLGGHETDARSRIAGDP